MIGSILSGVAGLAGTVYGAISSANARRKEQKRLAQSRSEALTQFNRDYYQDLTQRADVQYLLNQQREQNRDDITRARQTAVVAGSNAASEALAKNAAAKSMSQTLGKAASMSQQAKLNAVAQYNAALNRANAQQSTFNQQDAQSGANMMGSGFSTLGNGISSLSDYILQQKAKKKETQTDNNTES
jgi:hypothetical protein